MTSQDITIIIAALSLAAVQIITAWKTGKKVDEAKTVTEKVAERADEKLDEIHVLTNKNLKTAKDEAQATRDELKAANAEIAKLMRSSGLAEAKSLEEKK
jgi:hypothetical protein